MGRMGLTLKDLMEDPYARRWLGRALNVRHFLLGTIVETASFDVNTYLIDAEYGFLHGQGSVHVHHPMELKLRLSELAFLTLMDPGERARYQAEAQRFQALVLQGQQSMDRRGYPDAITAFEGALRIRPGNTEVQVYLGRARSLHQQYLWEEARRQEFLRQQAFAAERARRQWELAQAAEAARLRAAQGGIFLAVDLRQRAQSDLVTQARLALKVGNFSLSISKFQSAVALSPNDELYRELALARAQAARNAELAAAQVQAQREANLRKQREKEYFQARQTIAQNHLFTQTALGGQHKSQQERDQLAYQSAFDQGQRLLAKGDYDGAITNLQAARRMKKTEAVEALLAHAMVEQAKASAQAKGDLERQELERKLALERQRRLQAEAEAKRNQELYQAALQLAQKALAEKNYEVAQAKYEEAGKFFKTDVVLTGLRKTRDLRQKHQEKNVEDQERSARLQKYLLEGQVALKAKKYDAAVQAYAQARKLAPDNVDALTGLTKAEQLRDQAFDMARRQAEESTRQKNFQRLLKTGQDNLANKNYDAAVLALTEAVKLNPKDPTASAALQTAVKARGGDTKNQEEFKKKAFVYHKHLGEGKNALASKRYDEAIQAFAAAQKVLPGDKTSAEFLQEAQKAKQDQTAAITLAAKKKAEDLQRTLEVQKALKKGQTALAGKNLEEADQAIAMAVQLAPDDPAVLRAQRDLQAARKLAQAQAELQNKRAQQHQALMVFAQKELAAGRFEEAIKALTDANTLVPDNKTSQDLLRQAQKAQAEARALEEKALALKSQLERTERVKKHLVDTQVALKVKDFNVAAKHLAEARKLAPQDPAVLQAQRDLDTARQATLGAEKKLAAYQEAMAEGQKALNAKQFAGAVKAFTEATQLLPGDAKAGLLLKQAEQAWYDAKASSADLAKRQVNYQQALTQGQKALNAKQYPEAIKAFTEAGKWMPGDQKASQLLAQAQQGLNQSKKTPEEEPKKKVDPPTKKPAVGDPRAQYQKEMEQAETLEKQGKLAEAIQNYREALKLAPKDDKATTGLRRASFNLHLKEGQEDLNAGRYKAAIAHFEAALDIFPNNPAAQKLLARAKQGKK
jgi:tetratricopeptide (TPR) repeat protein